MNYELAETKDTVLNCVVLTYAPANKDVDN
jgi:hypothetical protein